MKFSNDVMTTPQMIKMGFTRRFLERAFRVPGQNFAWRQSRTPKSQIMWDTEKFDRWLEDEKRIQRIEREEKDGWAYQVSNVK